MPITAVSSVLPAHMTGSLRKLYLATQELTQKYGREPIEEELAAHLQLSPQQIRQLKEAAVVPLNLEQQAGDDSEAVLSDFIEDTNATQPTEEVSKAMLTDQIKGFLQQLSPREAQVISLRYGLGGHEPHTLKEIGVMLHLSRERIRQLEKEVLNKLRQPRFAEHLQPYLN